MAASGGVSYHRIGIDLGGTKIEGVGLGASNRVAAGPIRVATPKNDYRATLAAIRDVVTRIEFDLGVSGNSSARIGIGMPGSLSRSGGRVQNANSVWLNGRPLADDLAALLKRPIRFANDANCFALSEASDGAGAGAKNVFGVILGTGCGGGLVTDGALIDGQLGIAGEWGHNPLPWLEADEYPGPKCWCGRRGCMETWVSGPALEAHYEVASGTPLAAAHIAAKAAGGDETAATVLERHADRLARGLAHVMNIFDPDVVVLGGGLSNLTHLYEQLPRLIVKHLFTDAPRAVVRPPRWGDSSGVRGAACLWGERE